MITRADRSRRRRSAVRRGAVAVLVAALAVSVFAGPARTDDADRRPGHGTDPSLGPGALYLVTLEGPGTAGRDHQGPRLLTAVRMHAEQRAVLSEVDAPPPVYEWTTALNGVAVRLTRAQADQIATDPRVALVEKNQVRPLAGRSTQAELVGKTTRTRGGAGEVIGLVDSGIWPDSPAFSPVTGLGREPKHFRGDCEAGQGWPATTCNRKLVGARWFVDGFGSARLRSPSSLSPLDDSGHGTQIASIAAANGGVSARVRGQRLGAYAGVAPQARLAIYKACWTAPDPDNDGCATADVVTAIDEATADGVDVLNLSLAGPAKLDTVELALLGAAEADVVVVGAAGNRAHAVAAHVSPWTTTVGATTGSMRRGQVAFGGDRLTGAMSASRLVGPAPIVVGADVPASGFGRAAARICTPASLDASRVEGRIVLCERGDIGRIDKSAAVKQADGVGMVLTNVTRDNVVADFHSVPTVHLDRASGHELRQWIRQHPHGRVSLQPLGLEHRPARIARWSSGGAPDGVVIKPDLVAAGSGVLGVVPPSTRGQHWDLLSGTSAATAATAGAAALVRSRHPGWSAAAVRSALATTARRVPEESVLRGGAGRLAPVAALRPGLVYDVAPRDYRSWLRRGHRLNTPSIRLSRDVDTAHRTITNVTGRRLYFSSHTGGFDRHRVRVTPAAVRLGPGESARYTLHVGRTDVPQPLDDGWVTWRGATGTSTRIPVVITR